MQKWEIESKIQSAVGAGVGKHSRGRRECAILDDYVV